MEASKRSYSPGSGESTPAPHKKQRRDRHADSRGGQPDVDLTYGQRYVFSNLNDPTAPSSDDDFEVEDEADALAYLRSVRQEAGGIPHLLVATKAGPQLPPPPVSGELSNDDDDNTPVDRRIYTNGVGDSRGYYYDGAYTALPDDPTEEAAAAAAVDEDDDRDEAVRQALYANIIARFSATREMLRQPPPDDALLALPEDNDFTVATFGGSHSGQKSYSTWSWRLRHTDPRPAQVAAMDRAGAFRLLRMVLGDSRMLKRGSVVTERTAAWLWALLARLPDVGELDYTDVGVVRDLGKRAVLMMASIAHAAALRDEVELDEDGEVEEDAEHDLLKPNTHGPNEAGREPEASAEDGEVMENGDGNPQPAVDADAASEGEAMDLEEGEVEDGEVPDNGHGASATSGDLNSVKARLLSQLESPVNMEPEPEPEGDDWREAEGRAKMNMRATLNMILTVAGEFYGQRDLLEFRDPFRGL